MGSNRLARQSFGMFKICKDCILFELFMWKKKERKKRNKMEIFKFGFSNLLKVSGTFGADIALEYQREVVVSFLSSSAWFFWELFLYLMYRWTF